MRWLCWGLLVAAVCAALGCGGPTTPAQKTDPVPRQRFPQADR